MLSLEKAPGRMPGPRGSGHPARRLFFILATALSRSPSLLPCTCVFGRNRSRVGGSLLTLRGRLLIVRAQSQLEAQISLELAAAPDRMPRGKQDMVFLREIPDATDIERK